MKARMLMAGLAAAGTLAAGFAGVAYAQSPSTPSQSNTATAPDGAKPKKLDCSNEQQILAKIAERKGTIQSNIDKAKTAADKARAEGKEARAKKIEARIDGASKRLERLNKAEQKVHERCDASATPGS